jgi:Ca2+-binding RTX toxin-like protein
VDKTDVYAGNDNDTVQIGSLDVDYVGSVDQIRAELRVFGEEGIDTLLVDDSGDTANNSGQLTAASITGLGLSEKITYEAVEDLGVFLGAGDDTFTVTSTYKLDDFFTVTAVGTGPGDDSITVSLDEMTDGFIAVDAEDGDDVIDASDSTLPVVLFGGAGNDHISGGRGNDILFGDRGRVDYRDDAGQLVTRLGLALGERTVPASGPELPTDVPIPQTDGVVRAPVLLTSRDAWIGGNDVLIGGQGDDVLNVGSGSDTAEGESGDDVYTIVPSGLVEVIDVSGNDTLDFSLATSGVAVDIGLTPGKTQVVDDAGNELILTGVLENVTGSDFRDDVRGNEFGNILDGRGGDDTLRGRDGDDTLRGQAGRDHLHGGRGDDTLEGGDGEDRLDGDRGNDQLAGGADRDRIKGGAGLDLLFFPGATTGVTVSIVKYGSGKSTDGMGSTDRLWCGIEGAYGTPFDDRLEGDHGATVFYGLEGDDFLRGRGGRDMLDGGEGNDDIRGGRNDDEIRGGPGDDDIRGGRGRDRIQWFEGEGNDNIDADRGRDTIELVTGNGPDSILVSSPDDKRVTVAIAGVNPATLTIRSGNTLQIDTGDGEDSVVVDDLRGTHTDAIVVDLGPGNDSFDGQKSRDKHRVNGGPGNDTFIGGPRRDHFDGGADLDTIDYSTASRPVIVDLRYLAHADGRGSQDHLHNIENLIGSKFNDRLWGTDGDNNIHALEGDDKVWGRGGNDTIDGGEGDDTLHGDADADLLLGGTGADDLIGDGHRPGDGSSGRDVLIGGPGDDHLQGGDEEDLLIPATTSHDTNAAALEQVMMEWTANQPYAERTLGLLKGTGPTSVQLEPGSTVHDDGDSDDLRGNEGRDWFFACMEMDAVGDQMDDEIVTNCRPDTPAPVPDPGANYSWYNRSNPYDVDDDGVVAPIDALLIINSLNEDGARTLPKERPLDACFFDVNRDHSLAPNDAILVLNELVRQRKQRAR